MSASGNNGSRDAGTGNDGSQAAIPASAIAASRFPATGSLRIALVAGETSGDLLGAGLIAELRRRFPDAEFAGIGGDAMRGAGCQTWF
ncbi:MAG: lipid-A-disaccharide synthase, partial [Stenotrophomonas nitritireducens]|nr:lipid-A-disaccharide synthase [Stenotrophomonas nitritireducens]